MLPDRLIAPFVGLLVVVTLFGAVFMLGREAGLKAGAKAGAQAVERVSRDLGTCQAAVSDLKAAVARQNAATEAQAQAAAKAQAKAEAATRAAQAEAETHRARAARLLAFRTEGGECSQAAALLQAYGSGQ